MKLNVVPARTGLLWVKLGLRTFLKQPLALASLFFLYMAAVILISLIPVVGIVVGGMLVPAATLGLMAATEQALAGRFPMPTVLLSAFRAGRQRVRAMLLLGVVYAAASMVATQLAILATGGPGDPGNEINTTSLVALALHTPLFIAFWHAPALVHWHGVSPAKSLFFSAVACVRNFGALLVFGLTWLAVFLAVVSLVGVLGGVLGGPDVVRALLMPTALFLAAMSSTSLYFTFRDSFVADAPAEAHPPPPDSRT